MARNMAAQLGTFTTSANITCNSIKHLRVQALNVPMLSEVTGAADANARYFVNGIETAEFVSDGVISTTVDSLTYGLGQSCQFNFTESGLDVEPIVWTIHKYWGKLHDVTDSDNADKVWQVETPHLEVHVKSVVTTSGPNTWTDTILGTSMQIDRLGDIYNTIAATSGTAHVKRFQVDNNFHRGGPVPADILLEYGGTVAHELDKRSGHSQFTWLFPTSGQATSDDFPLASTTITYRFGADGDTANVEAFCYDAVIHIDRRLGGRIPIQTRWRVGSYVVPK